MKSIAIGVVCFLVGAGLVTASHAVSVNSGQFDATKQRVCIEADGTQHVVYRYSRMSDGRMIGARVVILGATAGAAVVDEFGQQVSATTGATAINARNSYLSALNTLEAAAATGGKLDL
jgi:hypothetical protein